MKKLVIFFLTMLVTGVAFAQSFTVSGTSASVNGVPSVSYFDVAIKVYNQSPGNLQMRWVRTQQLMPPTWRTSVCNASYCHTMSTDSAMFTMMPNDSDEVNIHFYPFNTSGNATITVKLFPVNDPSDFVVLTFYGNAPVGVAEHTKFGFSIYPNPAAEKLNVNLNAPAKQLDVEIHNTIGQMLKQESFTDVKKTAQVNVADLPSGYYFARIRDEKENVIVKKFVKN